MTTSIPTVPRSKISMLTDHVITDLNSCIFKLEAIIQVLVRKTKGVVVDKLEYNLDIDEDADEEYLLEEQFRMKLEEEEMLLFKEEQILEKESRLGLEEEAKMMREKENILEEEKFLKKDYKKRELVLMNSDHMKQAMMRVVPKKRSYCTGVTSSSWLKVSSKFNDKSLGRCVIDQDMTEFLKNVKPWSEDLSCCNTSIDNVWLTEDLDLYIGNPGMLRCRFSWCNDRMLDQKFWESLVCLDPPRTGWLLDDLLLQNSMPIWYANGETYNLPWSVVEQVFIPLNEPGEHWNLAKFDICSGLVTFYDSGDTYAIECRDWYIKMTNCLQTWKSIIDNTNFVVAYGACTTQPASFLTYDQGFVNANYICFLDVPFCFTRYPHFRPSLPDLNLNNKAIGSCYGLWCFSSNYMASIWNPSIRKSVGIILPYWVGNTYLEKMVFGFGVHPVSLDPTIVKIAYPKTDHGRWSVVVFKLSTKHWNIVPDTHVPRYTIRLKRSSH
ncbi:F-box domain containing protein [Tanacetum coccineum]